MRAIAKLKGFGLMKISMALCAALAGAGCATAALSQRGSMVEMTDSVDKSSCQNLGPVFGKGGGSFGGTWISDEDLMEYAANDLRNKAAEKGATHVVFTGHEMGNTSGKDGGTTSTATIMGVAYRCAPPARVAAPAAAPTAQRAPAQAAAAPTPAPAAGAQ
jgi:Domain of unknown function (DUF4156)